MFYSLTMTIFKATERINRVFKSVSPGLIM
ncbi:hypothetical protein E2C01_092147 [Portunus trituberculatus]|uniref:Uncharacterized protein n=1 Tax=Portunus trituberculatus TaxID=210409 RepID=A0A5B7JV12_PORTR|nr:hypothetical protein [Portunus trituberculatus]